jgi:hypothetical protein
MITVKLLCEFVTNPFGDERKAHELLTEIGGRDLSDAELAGGHFSFEIAFYFVALLAIDASIEDPSVRATFLTQLHDRIRATYAGATSTACLPELVLSPTEREHMNAALRRESPGPEGAEPDVALPTVTKSALFDLIGLRRLFEYRAAISGHGGGDRFLLLARQLLLHCSGRTPDAVVVTTIADLLMANYNIAAEIVTAGLTAVNTREIEGEDCSQPLPLGPGMPDLTGERPVRTCAAGPYLLLLYENLVPIGCKTSLSFKYVLALCDRQNRLPACFVTLENSSSISNVLCVFERSGSHSNYGLLQGHDLCAHDLDEDSDAHSRVHSRVHLGTHSGRDLTQEFIGKGLILLADRFDLGEIDEHALEAPTRRRGWRALFAPAA